MIFSGNGHPPDGHTPKPFGGRPAFLGTPWGETLVLVLLAAVITLYGLGSTSLQDNDETRFGLLARNMMETGDWTVPRWSHRPQGTKPPLFMWAVAGFSKLTGRVNAWSARLPSALAGVGVVVLTYLLGRRFFAHPVPFLGGLVMSTNVAFYETARTSQTDMLLLFFVLLAAALALEGHDRKGASRFLWVVGAYVAAALAVLTKGPVGLVLSGFILLSVLIARNSWRNTPFAAHAAGLIAAVAIAGAWYWLYQEAAGEKAIRQSIVRENWVRFVSAFDHRRPFYYYFYTFAGEFMPWTPLFLLGLAWAWVRRKSRTADYGAVLLWFSVVFVFFTLSASKRSQYILSLYPAASLLTAAFLATAMSPAGNVLTRWRRAGLWTCRGLAIAAIGIAVGGAVVAQMRFRPYLLPAAAGAVLLAVFGGWVLRETLRPSPGRVPLAMVMGFLTVHVLVQPIAVPYLEERKSPRPYAVEVANLVGSHHLVSYRFSRASLDFYAPRSRGEVYYVYDWGLLRYFFRDHQEPVFVLMSRENYRSLPPRALAGSSVFRADLAYRRDRLILLTNGRIRQGEPGEAAKR